MIHICFDDNLHNRTGGMRTYVDSLLYAGSNIISDRVITSLKDVEQSQFKLLHLHQAHMLWDLQGECPIVFTLHDHSAYCPSGTKFFTASGAGCDRAMSPLGCTWGRLTGVCGSRRPQNIIQAIQGVYQQLELFKKLKISVIAVSDYVRGQLIRNSFPPEQVVTLRNGVRIPKTATEPLSFETHQNLRLLFVGRLVPMKGLDWLLKALSHVDQRVHLDIAGVGEEQPRMEQLAKKLGVSDRVTWHGWCNGEKLEALYQQCYALIFPSLWHEPAGLVTLEAYARHRPVIASSLGGIPEYVRDGDTGILVPANDVKKLAAAITELAQNYQKTRRMGEQGYTWFLEEFTIDTHVQRLQKIYEKSIAEFHAQKLLSRSTPKLPTVAQT